MSGKTKELLIEFLGEDVYLDLVVENQVEHGKDPQRSVENYEKISDERIEKGDYYFVREVIMDSIVWSKTEKGGFFWCDKYEDCYRFLRDKGLLK